MQRVERTGQKQVLFETGYGPSGLPHIGTFGEVARTTMVRHAFETLTEGRIATHLLAFSDDLDGLRKVPDNIPNKELVAAHLGKPLTQVPDPFGEYPSFGEHNNARLRAFLDPSASTMNSAPRPHYYQSGRFDATLLKMLARYEAIQAIMLPSLRAERAASYSPFLPIHPHTGIVMQVPLEEIDVARGWSPGAIRTRASVSRPRSPAVIASCNGSPTGRCAGARSASITKWPART